MPGPCGNASVFRAGVLACMAWSVGRSVGRSVGCAEESLQSRATLGDDGHEGTCEMGATVAACAGDLGARRESSGDRGLGDGKGPSGHDGGSSDGGGGRLRGRAQGGPEGCLKGGLKGGLRGGLRASTLCPPSPFRETLLKGALKGA